MIALYSISAPVRGSFRVASGREAGDRRWVGCFRYRSSVLVSPRGEAWSRVDRGGGGGGRGGGGGGGGGTLPCRMGGGRMVTWASSQFRPSPRRCHSRTNRVAHFVWPNGRARATPIVKRRPQKTFWANQGLHTSAPPKWGRRVCVRGGGSARLLSQSSIPCRKPRRVLGFVLSTGGGFTPRAVP
jgi:hypothetical protein